MAMIFDIFIASPDLKVLRHEDYEEDGLDGHYERVYSESELCLLCDSESVGFIDGQKHP